MALTATSDQITNYELNPPATPGSAGMVYVVQSVTSVLNTLAQTNLVGLVKIPEYCLPVSIEMYLTDIDDASALVYEVGVLDTATTALVTGSKLVNAGGAVGQAAGMQRVNVFNGVWLPGTWLADALSPAEGAPKTIAMYITTAAGTPAAGTIYTTLFYRAAFNGV